MLNVLERTSEILLVIGTVTLLAGIKGRKTAAFVTGIIIALMGSVALVFDLIPNDYAKKIETKAVELRYGNWDKQVTVIISKSTDSYVTHHNSRRRRRYLYYLTYCTTGGLFTEKEYSEGSTYTEVLINRRLRAIKDTDNGLPYETIPVKESEYFNVAAGETVIVASRDDMVGKTLAFISPEYTPESWKKTYGIGEYYDSSDEFESARHPQRCKQH